MADQTTVLPLTGTPTSNGSLDLTTSEKEWAFTPLQSGTIQLICDAVWLFATQTSGSFFRIPAGAAFNVSLGTETKSLFLKTATGTGTIYVMVVE